MRTDQMVWVLELAERHLETMFRDLEELDEQIAETDPWDCPGEAESRHQNLFDAKTRIYEALRDITGTHGDIPQQLLEAIRDLRKAFQESLKRSCEVDEHGFTNSLGFTVSFQHPMLTNAPSAEEIERAIHSGWTKGSGLAIREFLARPEVLEQLEAVGAVESVPSGSNNQVGETCSCHLMDCGKRCAVCLEAEARVLGIPTEEPKPEPPKRCYYMPGISFGQNTGYCRKCGKKREDPIHDR